VGGALCAQDDTISPKDFSIIAKWKELDEV